MQKKEEFTVTPWEVTGEVDYDKLVEKFGVQHVSDEQVKHIEKKAGKRHFMLSRKIFFAHRDLTQWIAHAEKGEKVALYTGRGPSGQTHVGHLLPWVFNKYLQEAFDAPLYFQITDDEKFLFKEELSLEDTHSLALDNALDLIALGFDQKKTKIIIDTDYIREMYPLALDVAKRVTFSTAKAVFGFNDQTSIGEIFFTSMQSVPAFLPSVEERKKTGNSSKSVPVLIPCAIDQDPHFRVTRDVAEKMHFPKPSSFYCKFMPSLKGAGKMSASDPSSSIYTTDTPEEAERKIMSAFTGGRATAAEQKKLGGNPDICSVCNYLKFFFEEDDKKLDERLRAYKNGEILDGENKAYLAEKVKKFLKEHQRKREQSRKVLDKFLVKD